MKNSTTNSVLVIALVVAAFLILIFAGGMGAGFMTGNDWMASNGWVGGHAMTGGASMGGFGWMWFPVLSLIVIGAALVWAVFGKK